MEFSAEKIAHLIQGKIEGNPKVVVNDFGKIETATHNQLSFLANPKYESFLYTSNAAIIIIKNDLPLKQPISSTLIRVEDPYAAFAKLLELYDQVHLQTYKGIDKKASVSSKAKIGKNVYVGPNTVIEQGCFIADNTLIFANCYIGPNSTIGTQTIIHPNVSIYKHSIIGNNCIIHAGAVIGADGFGFAPLPDGSYKKIPQIGNVIIKDNVEIGANTTIDRATMGSTIIHQGVKLDNLIQIGHNVEIGAHTVIAAQTGIAGSTKIGTHNRIGGQVGISGHLKIGNNINIGPQSGILKNTLADNTEIIGSPALESKKFMKTQVHIRNLHNIVQKIDDLEKKINKPA